MTIIYISGIDGCGKTTQSTLLVEWMKDKNLSAEYQWLRWEPSIVPLLKNLRKIAGKPKTEAGEAANNKSLRKTEDSSHNRWTSIKNRLMGNGLFKKFWLWYACTDYYKSYTKASVEWKRDFIIMDRFLMDFVVDQALNFSVDPLTFLDQLEHTALAKMQKPSYSIFIDLPAEIGYERKLDGTPLEYLRDREAMYKSIPSSDSVLHVDGTLPPEQIHNEIKQWLSRKIGAEQ